MRCIFYILLISVYTEANAQKIRISIFNSIPVKGLVVSLYKENYGFYSENEKISGFDERSICYITLYNKRLLLSNSSGPVGCFGELDIVSENDSGKIMITVIDPKTSGKVYTGNIKLKVEYGRILLLNETDVEAYIAGVVEAESGINAQPEFYKAQALLCRTYLFSHLGRHESEGFNLCDEVHCQAYKGNTPFTKYIYKSTFQTNNKVVVDSDKNLITASFHANCGGQTESSFNTWLKPETYLAPVKDPYCHESSNARWVKRIPLTEWKKYLIAHGIKCQQTPVASLETKNAGRQIYYRVNKDSLLMRQIRSDWNLKSSFFEVGIKNNTVTLQGLGYGHGVGLCQDGAMKMAAKGFSCDEIIKFYFKGVRIEALN